MISSSQLEKIFAHAAALHSEGKMKNWIYGKGNVIYILNTDCSLLMRFRVPWELGHFCFSAHEYEGQEFHLSPTGMVFKTHDQDYERTKFAPINPPYSSEQVEKVWNVLEQKTKGSKLVGKVVLDDKILKWLEKDLPHVEFVLREGNWSLIQRNIYTGEVVQITKKPRPLTLLGKDEVNGEMNVGLRTNDFFALFTFSPKIDFYFYHLPFAQAMNLSFFDMRVFLGRCFYDSLGNLEVIYGREIQEVRHGEPSVDRKNIERRKELIQKIKRRQLTKKS